MELPPTPTPVVPAPKPKRPLWQLAAAGVAGLFVLCCLGSAVISALAPKAPAQASGPTVQAVFSTIDAGLKVDATDVPARTQTAAPTETAAPEPTATLPPELTATTPPEPTATSGISPEVAAYGTTMGTQIGIIAEALGELAKLLQAPEPASDSWKIDVAVQIAAIRAADEAVRGVTNVPADMAEIHAKTTDATSDCNAMTVALASGIDTLNTATLNRAAALMTSCGAKIGEAGQMAKEYNAANK